MPHAGQESGESWREEQVGEAQRGAEKLMDVPTESTEGGPEGGVIFIEFNGIPVGAELLRSILGLEIHRLLLLRCSSRQASEVGSDVASRIKVPRP